jgi:hypothetical protein
VLARALEVAPALLLFPAGYVETVEVQPGEHVQVGDAITWLSGELALPDDPFDAADRWRDASLGAALYRAHADDLLRRDIADEMVGISERDLALSSDDAVMAEARLRVAAGQQMVVAALEVGIRQMREVMRELGYLPPQLPGGLTYLDGDAKPGTDDIVARSTDWLASRPLLREAIQRARVRKAERAGT